MPGISLYNLSSWNGSSGKEPLCIAIFISNYQNLYVFLIISYVFSSTKSEKRVEQVLPRSSGGDKKRGKGGVEGAGWWPKQCIDM
jgi:hypothetical protein